MLVEMYGQALLSLYYRKYFNATLGSTVQSVANRRDRFLSFVGATARRTYHYLKATMFPDMSGLFFGIANLTLAVVGASVSLLAFLFAVARRLGYQQPIFSQFASWIILAGMVASLVGVGMLCLNTDALPVSSKQLDSWVWYEVAFVVLLTMGILVSGYKAREPEQKRRVFKWLVAVVGAGVVLFGAIVSLAVLYEERLHVQKSRQETEEEQRVERTAGIGDRHGSCSFVAMAWSSSIVRGLSSSAPFALVCFSLFASPVQAVSFSSDVVSEFVGFEYRN